MKTKIIIFLLLVSFFTIGASATESLSQRLSGRILLQIEDKGRCWYLNPANLQRYSLGTPTEAFGVMRKLGIGITNADLQKINTSLDFAKKHAGKIFIQTEKKGAAWYINPTDLKAYSLGNPTLAFEAMRKLSLGISNQNLYSIPAYYETQTNTQNTNNQSNASNILSGAATAISDKNKEAAIKYFIPEMEKGIIHSIDNMSNESLFILAGILRGSTLKESSDTKKVYTNQVYFNGTKKDLFFNIVKQSDGSWKIINL